MGRPKKYHTKAERVAANRQYQTTYYNKKNYKSFVVKEDLKIALDVFKKHMVDAKGSKITISEFFQTLMKTYDDKFETAYFQPDSVETRDMRLHVNKRNS